MTSTRVATATCSWCSQSYRCPGQLQVNCDAVHVSELLCSVVMQANLICTCCGAQEDALIDKLRMDLAEHACVWTDPHAGGAVFELRPPPVGLYQCVPVLAFPS